MLTLSRRSQVTCPHMEVDGTCICLSTAATLACNCICQVSLTILTYAQAQALSLGQQGTTLPVPRTCSANSSFPVTALL